MNLRGAEYISTTSEQNWQQQQIQSMALQHATVAGYAAKQWVKHRGAFIRKSEDKR